MSLNGTPSIIHSGWLLSVSDELPRSVILVEPPSPVPAVFIWSPATLPLSILVTDGSPVALSFSPLMSCTAYPSIFFSRFMPSAVTTTSSICCVSSDIDMLKLVSLPTLTVTSLYPMYENTSTDSLPDTLRVKSPSSPVITPLAVPFSNTFTPMSGSPLESVTMPVTTILSCWEVMRLMSACPAWLSAALIVHGDMMAMQNNAVPPDLKRCVKKEFLIIVIY